MNYLISLVINRLVRATFYREQANSKNLYYEIFLAYIYLALKKRSCKFVRDRLYN